MNDPNTFLWRAFSRNIGLVSLTEQQKLFDSRVAIPGMGGVGGVHLITQARLGIGGFNIADFDTFETENTNRQYGAAVSTYGRSKVDVMAERALDINPHLKINRFPEGLNDRNLNDFLKDVDVVVDGLDAFALDARRLLCNGALERGIPFVTAGPIGFGVSMLVFKPGSLPFDQYFDLRPGMSNEERLAAFLAALTPWSDYIRYIDRRYASLRERRGPSLSVACELCAGFAGTETLKLILKRGKIYPVPHAVRIDSYLASYRRKKLLFLNRGPLQKLKRALILKRLNAEDGELRAPSSIPPMESSGPITEEAVKFVVRAGILAISGDNSQHWKFDWWDPLESTCRHASLSIL